MLCVQVPCDCGKHGYDGYCVNLQSGWTRVLLEPSQSSAGKRVYEARMEPPGDGRYVAFLIDIKYAARPGTEDAEMMELGGIPTDLPGRLEFTSEVSIVPNTHPYEDCEGAGCRGSLV